MESFSELIYVPRIDIFKSFTACSQILIPISVKKVIEGCVDVVEVTYMIIVSQQSDSFLLFLHNPLREFAYNVPLYKIDIKEKNCE